MIAKKELLNFHPASNLVNHLRSAKRGWAAIPYMTHFTVRRGALSTLAGLLLFTGPPRIHGQDAVSPTSAQLETSTTTEAKTAPSGDLGTGIFSPSPFKLSASVRAGYDDNVTTSNQFKEGSPFTTASVALTYDFGDARTQVSLETGVAYTYYWDKINAPGISENNYDISTYLRLTASHKVSPRITLTTSDYLAYQTEPDFAVSQGSNRRGGNYFVTTDKFTLNYLWSPRFATATSYTLGVLNYDDMVAGLYQDYWQNTFGNEFRYLVTANTTLAVEYRFQIVTYAHIPRDSTTNFALAGLDHTFNPQLNVSVRGGAQFRQYEEGSNRTSPYFEGTLNYTAGKQTTISWLAHYSIEEPDTLLNPSRDTFRTGVTARHDFTSKVTGSLALYYEHDDYQSINQPGFVSSGFTEESVDLGVSVRYAVTRNCGIEAGYNFTNIVSDESFREYTRNRYWGGVNVTF